MRVEIRIEQLSINGVAVTSRRQLAKALEQELSRLFGEQGVPEALKLDVHRRRVQSADLPLSARPGADASVGRGLARRVYQSLHDVRHEIADRSAGPIDGELRSR